MVRRRQQKGGKRKWGQRKSKYVRGGSGNVQALKTLTVPDRIKVKLPYHTVINYASAVGVQDQVFNLNSIYDPDRTGVGHQPLGFDQWAAFYNRYRVYGVKVRWTITNRSEVPVNVALIGNNDPTMVLGNDNLFEQSHMNKVQIGSKNGIDTKVITKYFTPARLTGRPLVSYVSDDRYQATMINNPIETIVGHFYIANADASVQALACNCSIHITYMVELFDRRNLNLSNTTPELRGPEKNLLEDGTLENPPVV